MNKKTYEFGEFRLDLDGKRLMRHGQTVSLQPKVFDMLVFFLENRGALVSRDQLMDAVWKNTFVEESNLRFCLHALRKALGKTADGRDFVETIPKRGYRFTAEVAETESEILPEKTGVKGILPENKVPPQNIEKRLVKRRWLIGISFFSIICLLALAVAWRKNGFQPPPQTPENKTLAVLPFLPVNENEGNLQMGLADALARVQRVANS